MVLRRAGERRRPAGDPRHAPRRALAWLDRWLKRDSAVETGPAFERIADDGVWRGGRRVGAFSRVVLRSRLRTAPCEGTVRFTIRAHSVRRSARATVTPRCDIRAVMRLRAPAGQKARVTARFEGNAVLAPRRTAEMLRRLR